MCPLTRRIITFNWEPRRSSHERRQQLVFAERTDSDTAAGSTAGWIWRRIMVQRELAQRNLERIRQHDPAAAAVSNRQSER